MSWTSLNSPRSHAACSHNLLPRMYLVSIPKVCKLSNFDDAKTFPVVSNVGISWINSSFVIIFCYRGILYSIHNTTCSMFAISAVSLVMTDEYWKTLSRVHFTHNSFNKIWLHDSMISFWVVSLAYFKCLLLSKNNWSSYHREPYTVKFPEKSFRYFYIRHQLGWSLIYRNFCDP